MKPAGGLKPLFLVLGLLIFAKFSIAVCYHPNAESEQSDEYEKCGFFDSKVTRMCCATRRSGDNGIPPDQCLQSGLCRYEVDFNRSKTVTYFRDQCSSNDWTDPGCLNVCTGESNPVNGSSSRTVQMTPCDGTANSTTWCCGDSRYCCGTLSAVTIAQVLSLATSSPTSTSGIPTPSTSPRASSGSNSGLSTGAQTGVGVGVAVGALVILALVWYFLRRRKSGDVIKQDWKAPNPQPSPAPATGSYNVYEVSGSQTERSELAGTRPV